MADLTKIYNQVQANTRAINSIVTNSKSLNELPEATVPLGATDPVGVFQGGVLKQANVEETGGEAVTYILEYADLASFPTTGEAGKIYVDLSTNMQYRWDTTEYVAIGGGGGGIEYTDITWAELVALGTRAQGGLYNITTENPADGEIYGEITLINPDYFIWANSQGTVKTITIQ